MRIENTLESAIAGVSGRGCPPGLAEAMHYAVFPGGARVRPRLCLAVALACGDGDPQSTDAAAAAIELLHCASLVHDDLPCFDDAPTRRGRPSVHRAFGERLAVLVGDALIVLAFEILARRIPAAPAHIAEVMATVAGCVGAPNGICAGQAWECETQVALTEYHREKTGSLFVAAAVAGAQSVGAQVDAWRLVGDRLGEAYQVADDLGDATGFRQEFGKPVGRDGALGRPNAALELGIQGAVSRVRGLVASASESIPACPGAHMLRALIAAESHRILPKELSARRMSRSGGGPGHLRPGPPFLSGLHGRWLSLRNRLLSSPAFQRWASAFPLTRPIARRRARSLFDLCAGFVYSQVLYACVELDLFALLASGPVPIADLARRLDLPESRASCLLDAAQALGLAERIDRDRFVLGPLGAALRGNAGVAEMVRHHAMLYRDLADPVALLRGEREATELGAYWAYVRGFEGGEAPRPSLDYTHLMGASQGLVATDILDAYSFAGHRRLLDLGGGDGSFLAAVAARWPHLETILFDLPPVAERARARFAALGLGERASVLGGDLFLDPLPSGVDCCSLVRVIHDHDDDRALAILVSARRALALGGTLILAEPMRDTPGAEPMGAYFGLYLLAMGSGRPRSAAELTQMLLRAGFGRVRQVRTHRPLLVRLLVATV